LVRGFVDKKNLLCRLDQAPKKQGKPPNLRRKSGEQNASPNSGRSDIRNLRDAIAFNSQEEESRKNPHASGRVANRWYRKGGLRQEAVSTSRGSSGGGEGRIFEKVGAGQEKKTGQRRKSRRTTRLRPSVLGTNGSELGHHLASVGKTDHKTCKKNYGNADKFVHRRKGETRKKSTNADKWGKGSRVGGLRGGRTRG